jgi:glutamate-1-semialdehyde 2,1-aminomutase
VPKAAVAETLVAPYNVVPALTEDVACVIVEPVAANMGLVPPVPGFLEGLCQACNRVGAVLIFDEVITGFRLSRGGAAAVFGVRPDLWCFGKVIGGGLPLAAFGGRRDLMEQLAPVGTVYQAGTLSGNPLATAAGLAVLAELDDATYKELVIRVGRFAAGVASALGPGVQVPVTGPLVGVFFTAQPVINYQGATESAASGRYPGLMHGLLERGVAIAPGAYEVLFPSLAHSDADLEQTVEAFGALAQPG